MKSIIIEDEKPAARKLHLQLERLGVEVVKELNSVEEAKEWFAKNPAPDLLFSDIQLGDGLSFAIFDEIKVKSAIIFTTAFDEYALRAFKLNSIDYLLKPIDEDELKTAVQKYQSRKINPAIDLSSLKNMLLEETKGKQYKNRFSVRVGEHIKLFKSSEITCFFSENKATYLRQESRNYILEMSLEELENVLNPSIFFRVNRKIILHLDKIKDIIRYSNSRLKVKIQNFEEMEIIVSRDRVKKFKEWLDN